MAKPLVTDELWEVIEPLLPEELPKPKGGRPRVSDRATLAGIIFVLKSGIPWEMLPQEMGCGCGMTCSGDASRSGTKPACGSTSTGGCWTAWGKRTRSTGRAPRWTRQRCRPPGERKSRAESDG